MIKIEDLLSLATVLELSLPDNLTVQQGLEFIEDKVVETQLQHLDC